MMFRYFLRLESELGGAIANSDLTGPSSICVDCKITLTVNTNAQLTSWKKQFAKKRIENYSIVRRWPKPDHT